METSTKNLKKAIKELNEVLTENKVRSVGIKLVDMTNAFGDAVEKATKDGMEVPDSVIEYYNLIFTDDGEDKETISDVNDDETEQTPEEVVEDILNSPDPCDEEDGFPEDSEEISPVEDDVEDDVKETEKVVPVERKKPVRKSTAKKKYKIRHPKMDGVVAEACKLMKANPNIANAEILDELETIFPDRTRKEMYSTVGHAVCVGRCMLVLFGVKIGG